MGTSAGGGGAGGGNPLIPGWIDQGGLPSAMPQSLPLPPEPNDKDKNGKHKDCNDDNKKPDVNNNQAVPVQEPVQQQLPSPNRYTQPRKDFNKYVSSGGTNANALKSALKGYSRNAAGGTQRLARRMQPMGTRVARFYGVVDEFKQRGKLVTLQQFNLSSYENRPLVDVLSAFADIVFGETGKIYENTQDDSIAKQAYSDTVIRIAELENINLDNLSEEQVEVMIAIYIEETIAHRVINDIGNKLTEKNTDIEELVKMEEGIYQIVKGLVRVKIMPEIKATNRGDRNNMVQKIENIYRVAFDAMAGINN